MEFILRGGTNAEIVISSKETNISCSSESIWKTEMLLGLSNLTFHVIWHKINHKSIHVCKTRPFVQVVVSFIRDLSQDNTAFLLFRLSLFLRFFLHF